MNENCGFLFFKMALGKKFVGHLYNYWRTVNNHMPSFEFYIQLILVIYII